MKTEIVHPERLAGWEVALEGAIGPLVKNSIADRDKCRCEVPVCLFKTKISPVAGAIVKMQKHRRQATEVEGATVLQAHKPLSPHKLKIQVLRNNIQGRSHCIAPWVCL